MNSHGVKGGIHRCLGSEELGHACLQVGSLAGVLYRSSIEHEEASGLYTCRHGGELDLNRLMFCDGKSEGLPLLCVRDCSSKCVCGDAGCRRCNAEAPDLHA